MKSLAVFLISCLITIILPATSFGQTIDDHFINTYLHQNKYAIDTEANAITLYEKATVKIDKTTTGRYYMTTTYHEVIKILKSSAFYLGNVSEEISTKSSVYDYFNNIVGYTYTLDGDSVIKTPLSSSAIYQQNNNGTRQLKFNMPAVKEGAIIDYSYDKVTDVKIILPRWYFQTSYPTLTSEYELNYPPNFQFVAETQSASFVKYNSLAEAEKAHATAYNINGEKALYNNMCVIWGRKNVAGIKEEPYISSIENHIEWIQIQMQGVTFSDGEQQTVFKSWDEFNRSLWDDNRLGGLISGRNSFLSDTVNNIIRKCTTVREKTFAIYDFVRKNFNINNEEEFEAKNLKKIWINRRGNEADINLLLTAMLRNANIDAYPLFLTTFGYPRAKELYPLANSFNYIATAVLIDSEKIFLDASNRYNKFGQLMPNCYNGYARIIKDKNGEGLYLWPDNLDEKRIDLIKMSGVTDTATIISHEIKFGSLASMTLRKKFKENDKAFSEFLNKQINTIPANVTLTSSELINLDDVDTNLIIKYTYKFNNTKQTSNIFINTDVVDYYQENPFKPMLRRLPVELSSRQDIRTIFIIDLPPNYVPDKLPQSATIVLGDHDMTFSKLYQYDSIGHKIYLHSQMQIKGTIYDAENYESLRNYFAKVIGEENKVITVKVADVAVKPLKK